MELLLFCAMKAVDIPATPLLELIRAKLLGAKDALQRMQAAVDYLTWKAKSGSAFKAEERTFLVELFECFAWGGRGMGYFEAAKLAQHYVHGDGQLLQLDESLYSSSVIVMDVQRVMKREVADLLRRSKGAVAALSSADSRLLRRRDFLALQAKSRNLKSQGRVLHGGWLFTEQDNQRLQKANNRFQLTSLSQPNDAMISTTWRVDDEYVFEPFSKGFFTEINLGPKMTLKMPDGLSQYMTKLGIAKEFKHFAEWKEIWSPDAKAEKSLTPADAARQSL
jgi:hypothetical protein